MQTILVKEMMQITQDSIAALPHTHSFIYHIVDLLRSSLAANQPTFPGSHEIYWAGLHGVCWIVHLLCKIEAVVHGLQINWLGFISQFGPRQVQLRRPLQQIPYKNPVLPEHVLGAAFAHGTEPVFQHLSCWLLSSASRDFSDMSSKGHWLACSLQCPHTNEAKGL